MARRMKSAAAPAITSLTELTARVGRWAAVQAQMETLAAQASEEITAVKARLAAALEPLEAELKAIHLAAKPWWAANSEQLTEGKKKSVELAGCLIGERLSKPALAYPKPEDTAVNLIDGKGWKALLRVKIELDKPAILKALAFEAPACRAGLAAAAPDGPTNDQINENVAVREGLEALGFSVAQKEEFFIARVADAAEPAQIVEDPAQQVAA